MIICGYQGIGKSTLANAGNGYIDLESGNFFVGGNRHDDWYIPYCKIAMNLSDQGYCVFISSHSVVREYLADKVLLDKRVVFPSLELKDAWISKLKTRWEDSNKDKDYRAYMNAVEKYDENIRDLMNQDGFLPLPINDINYNLYEVITRYNV